MLGLHGQQHVRCCFFPPFFHLQFLLEMAAKSLSSTTAVAAPARRRSHGLLGALANSYSAKYTSPLKENFSYALIALLYYLFVQHQLVDDALPGFSEKPFWRLVDATDLFMHHRLGLSLGRDFICFLVVMQGFFVPYYFGISAIYILLDVLFGTHLKKYKVQSEVRLPMWASIKKALPRVALNMFVVQVLVGIACFPLWKAMGGTSSPAPQNLPGPLQLLSWLAIAALGEEFGFYYTHRLFHHEWFYARFHKIHHSFKAPFALAAVYAHPLEHLISNVGPLLLFPSLCGAHVFFIWWWMMIAILNTCTAHSGYYFPMMPSSVFHDFHHEQFKYCFGTFGLLDAFHGTDSKLMERLEAEEKAAAKKL